MFIRKVTNGLWICNDCARNIAMWFNHKFLQFGGATDFFTGFLFNMLGKSIQLNTAFAAIDAAQKNGSDIIVWSQFGRILDLLLDFNPTDAASLAKDKKVGAILGLIKMTSAFQEL